MIDESQLERRAQLIAAGIGLAVLGLIAVLVALSEGASIGFAVFALGLTFVALFVLLVRFLVRRALASRPPPPPPPQSIALQGGRRIQRGDSRDGVAAGVRPVLRLPAP